jgi:hypothetical protein
MPPTLADRPNPAPRTVARLRHAAALCLLLLVAPLLTPLLRRSLSRSGDEPGLPDAPPPAVQNRFAEIYRRLHSGPEQPPSEYALDTAPAFPGVPNRESWVANWFPGASLGVRAILDRRTGMLVAFGQGAPHGAAIPAGVEGPSALRTGAQALRAGRLYLRALGEGSAAARLTVVAAPAGGARPSAPPPTVWHLSTVCGPNVAPDVTLDIALDAPTGTLISLRRSLAPDPGSTRPRPETTTNGERRL